MEACCWRPPLWRRKWSGGYSRRRDKAAWYPRPRVPLDLASTSLVVQGSFFEPLATPAFSLPSFRSMLGMGPYHFDGMFARQL